MSINHAQLKQEIVTDARAYGWPALYNAGNDTALAAALNLARTGANGGPAISIKRPDIGANELLEAVDIRDFPAAPAQVSNNQLAASWFESVTQFPRLRLLNENGTNTRVRTNLNRLLGDTNGSQARLDALAVKAGSRAEELFGFGTVVSADDIAIARQS